MIVVGKITASGQPGSLMRSEEDKVMGNPINMVQIAPILDEEGEV